MQQITIHLKRVLPWASILLVAFLAYGNSLSNGFAIDDSALLLANAAVHGVSLQNLKAIFLSVPNQLEYLPIRDLTYCLDYGAWKLNPFGYHLANLIYYALCCALIYLFLVKLLRRWIDSAELTACFAALLFALHPVHVESVAGIAQRKDLISGIFLILSLHGYLIHIERRHGRAYAWSLLFFGLSLLSKGTVVMLPLLIVCLEYYLAAEQKGRSVKSLLRALPFAVVAVIFVVVQSLILKEGGILKTHYYAASGYAVRIYTAVKAAVYYLKLLVIPYPLTILRRFDFSPRLLDLTVLLSAACVAALIVLAWRFRRSAPPLSFSVAWYLICLIPVVGLFPTSTVVAERYLFLPSIGFCLLCGHLLSRVMVKVCRGKTVALALLGIMLGGYSVITIERNRDWKSALTLYQAGVRHDPGSPRLNWLAGRELFWEKKYDEAFGYFARAAQIDPAYGMDYLVFSAVRAYEAGQPYAALSLLRQIRIPIGVEVVDINYVYGLVYEAGGDLRRAEEYYRKASEGKTRLGIYYQWDARSALQRLKGKQ